MAGSIINLLYEEAQRIWRYRWLVVAVALALFTTAAAYIMRLPDIYEVSAQILVNKQTTVTAAAGDSSLVGGEFGSPYVVQRTLLNDHNLRNVVIKVDPAAAKSADLSGEMASIRSRIRIENDGDDGFFNIGYRGSDPVQAYNVVQALLDQFITANVSRSTSEIAKATVFLDKQIADYSAKLRASNQEIADFRRRHPDVANVGTPGMTSDAASEVASARAAYEAALAGGGTVRAANPMAEQIATARQRLASLKLQYTDRYPDVVAAQRELDALIAANASAAAAPAVSGSAVVDRARGRLAAAQARLRRAEQGPAASQLSAEWADLRKNNDILRNNYEQMMSKREAARMSQTIYGDKDSGKYQVTNPPVMPTSPSGPDRQLFLIMAAAVALGGGIAAAYLLGAINGIFVTPRELEEAFGLPVAGTVSLERTWQTDASSRRNLTAMTLFAGVMAGAITGLITVKTDNDASVVANTELVNAHASLKEHN
jgi:polysaccharide chain length determinant protein (PEP-CTERM system associated)